MTRIGKTKPEESIVCRIFLRALLAGLVVTSGCVPMMVYTFYEPSAETGIVERHACYGNAGPRNTIRFQRDDWKFSLYSKRKDDKNLMIHISVTPSPEKVLRFLSQDFTATIEGKVNKSRPSKVLGFYYYNPYTYTGSGSTDSRTEPLLQWASLSDGYDVYFMSLYLPIGDSTNFELQFPPMEVNQQPILIPPITFSQKTESFFIEPINC